MNYYQNFQGQIDNIKKTQEDIKKPTLLLHACCAPCSSHVLSVVCEFFDVTVYFSNPNIDDKEEYYKRLDELKRFVTECDFAAVSVLKNFSKWPGEERIFLKEMKDVMTAINSVWKRRLSMQRRMDSIISPQLFQ